MIDDSDRYEENLKLAHALVWVVLALLWSISWYLFLSDTRSEMLAKVVGCGDGWGCGIQRNNAAMVLWGGMAFVLVLTLFFIPPAKFIALRIINRIELSAERKKRVDAELHQRQLESDVRERLRETEKSLSATGEQQGRMELLQKLGTVSDLLRIHAREEDNAEIRQIEHDLARVLRDITSRYTLEQLSATIRRDAALTIIAPLIIENLKSGGLERLPEARILNAAWQSSTASII